MTTHTDQPTPISSLTSAQLRRQKLIQELRSALSLLEVSASIPEETYLDRKVESFLKSLQA